MNRFINPTRKTFASIQAHCGSGPVPFVVKVPNDQYSPAGLYRNMVDQSRYAFMFESVELDERLGRYSFLGAQPSRIYTCAQGVFYEFDSEGNELASIATSDPLRELERATLPWRARWPAAWQLPPLAGGLVGFLGYDCAHYFEPIGKIKKDSIGMPDMVWMLMDTVLCFDHLRSQIMLVRCTRGQQGATRKAAGNLYDQLSQAAEDYADRYLRMPKLSPPSIAAVLAAPRKPAELPPSNFSRDEFMATVRRVKKHIRAGDIFQMVLAQRFSMPLLCSPLDVYRALRKLNPSRYMFALKLDDCALIASSPEAQVRCAAGQLELTPIAGSCPRGGDPAEDRLLAAAMLKDEKELAEHRMLVDLARNDLGRVARPGSVAISRLMEVTKHSHVMHLASRVRAELADEYSFFDVLRATFPAGTLSGAPKVRAMQLINEFENVRRNAYGGVVGYVDFAGNGDTCIAIRMLMAKKGMAHVQAGCGLVADSKPAKEYQETLNKAGAVLQAITEAEAGL